MLFQIIRLRKIASRKCFFFKFKTKLFLNKYCVKNHLTKLAIDVNKIVNISQTRNSNGPKKKKVKLFLRNYTITMDIIKVPRDITVKFRLN